MQCACPQCGILLGHRIQGLESACCCPECGFVCRACLGTNSILSVNEIKQYMEYNEAAIMGEEMDEE